MPVDLVSNMAPILMEGAGANNHAGLYLYWALNVLIPLATYLFIRFVLASRGAARHACWVHGHGPEWIRSIAWRDWNQEMGGPIAAEPMRLLLHHASEFLKARRRAALVGLAMALPLLWVALWIPGASIGAALAGFYMRRALWTPKVWLRYEEKKKFGRHKTWSVTGPEIINQLDKIDVPNEANRMLQRKIASSHAAQGALVSFVIALGAAWVPMQQYIVPWNAIVEWEGVFADADGMSRDEAYAAHLTARWIPLGRWGKALGAGDAAKRAPGAIDSIKEWVEFRKQDAFPGDESPAARNLRHLAQAAKSRAAFVSGFKEACEAKLRERAPGRYAVDGEPLHAAALGLPMAEYIAGYRASQIQEEGGKPNEGSLAELGLLPIVEPAAAGAPKRWRGACLILASEPAANVAVMLPNNAKSALYGSPSPAPYAMAREAGFVDGVAAQGSKVSGGRDLAAKKALRAHELSARLDPVRAAPPRTGTPDDRRVKAVYGLLLHPQIP